MGKCLNINSDAFKSLASQTSTNPAILKVDIELWMDKNNTLDRFPTLEELGITPIVVANQKGNFSIDEIVASEKTIRDLADRMSDRIGIPYKIISDRSQKFKGKIENNTAIINLAYTTLDTPIHEILGHFIIRAIKNRGLDNRKIEIRKTSAGYQVKFTKPDGFIENSNIFKTEKEANNYANTLKIKGNPELYQNLLKELEYGIGKDVLDRIKRDYQYKYNIEKTDSEYGDFKINSSETGARYFNTLEEAKAGLEKYGIKYSLEEQQEEAIVELLGLMTAKKLDNVRDGKFISLLKRLLAEIKDFVRNLLKQREVIVDHLPDNMTIGDLSDLLAYSNSKLILPGYEVKYTTPDNKVFKTYSEVSKHIFNLAKSIENINLDDIKINTEIPENIKLQIEKLKKDIIEVESQFNSEQYKKEKANKLKKLNKELEDLRNTTPEFTTQEPYLTKEEKSKYGFDQFEYIRIESTYSRKDIYNSQGYTYAHYAKFREVLGDNYEGYYIHGYNTKKGEGIPDTKILKVTKEQAKEIWSDKEGYEKFPIEINQKISSLEDELRGIQSDFVLNIKINLLKGEIKSLEDRDDSIKSFIKRNKKYEQAKEVIEEWKRVNNIQYNPEEVYSRGQEFVSIVGAYSDFDVQLMMQNLLQHIEDNQRAGGEFTISAFTRPIDKRINHLDSGYGKIKFKIYPQSKDIKWAANSDVYSGSVWDASVKVNKNKQSELLGVSYSKYPSIDRVEAIQPNLASVIDNLDHYHNELGIAINGTNFRLEYDNDIPKSTKKIVDSINSILDQKYGKLIKPDTSKKVLKSEKTYEVRWKNGNLLGRYTDYNKAKAAMSSEYTDSQGNKVKPEDAIEIVEGSSIEQIGIQPTQTNDNIKEPLNNVSERLGKDVYHIEKNSSVDKYVIYGSSGVRAFSENFDSEEDAQNFLDKKYSKKEHTEQALINLKISRLKEISKKYPRSLIRSEVKRINNSHSPEYIFEPEDLPFQKIPSNKQTQQPQVNEVKEVNTAIPEKIHPISDRITPQQLIQSRKYLNSKYSQKVIEDRLDFVTRLFTNKVNRLMDNPIFAGKTRIDVIKEVTPQEIFNILKEELKEALNNPEFTSDLSPSQIEGYNNLVKDFFAFTLESMPRLYESEYIRVDAVGIVRDYKNINQEEDNEDFDEGNETITLERREDSTEGWQIKVMNVNPKKSLSKETRDILRNIVRRNPNGEIDVDDLGNPRYIDWEKAHSILINKLTNMETNLDMVPILKNLVYTEPWVTDILELLAENEVAFSKFYMDFKKDEIPYHTQIVIQNEDGSFSTQTKPLNTSSGEEEFKDTWKYNVESGFVLEPKYSVYNEKGELNSGVLKNNQAVVLQIKDSFSKLTNNADRYNYVKDNIDLLLKLARGIAINTDENTLLSALTFGFWNDKVLLLPMTDFIDTLTTINNVLDKEEHRAKIGQPLDLITIFRTKYSALAKILIKITGDRHEASIFENKKSYYSYSVPTYLGKVMRGLRGLTQDTDRFFKEEFDDYIWFYKEGNYRSEWLRRLKTDPQARKDLEHHVMLSYNKIDFSKLTDFEYDLALLNNYFFDPNEKLAWYHIPPTGDITPADFIKFYRYTNANTVIQTNGSHTDYKSFLTDRLVELARQEYDRIKIVKARNEGFDTKIINDNFKIDSFDNKGLEFQFLPYLNDSMKEIEEFAKAGDNIGLDNLLKNIIQQNMNSKFKANFQAWSDRGILEEMTTEESKTKLRYLQGFNSAEDAKVGLEEYFWNSVFATSQIIQLTTTDLANYKSIEDFQKRYKQTKSPMSRLNTNSKYGKKIERSLYLKDITYSSSAKALESIRRILTDRVEQKLMSKLDMETILKSFGKINSTDGQTFRGIYSFRSILDMAGQWTDDMEKSMNNILKGEWDMNDFDVIWQPKKPYMYTQSNIDSQVKIDGYEENARIKLPIQHKNSEFLMLMSSLLDRSEKLRAIREFMDNQANNIDVIIYESGVKVGVYGAIDLNGLNTFAEVTKALQDGFNAGLVHETSYEDYGFQQEVPEHITDAVQLFGTQLRKHITSDISDNPNNRITIGNKSMTKKEWLHHYNSLIVENLLDAHDDVRKLFADPKEIERLLIEECREKGNLDLMFAVSLNDKGVFSIPLHEPSQSLRIQSMLNSIIRSRITSQKVKGGSAVLVSAVGTDLEIVYNDDKSIKYFECYMPWYTKKYFEKLIDKTTGQLNIKNIPPELRTLFGYRIPTEDKYSMVPLYIKDFLPFSSGSSIVLPADIVNISGSDYDIDKLYLMIPEFFYYSKDKERRLVETLLKDAEAKEVLDSNFDERFIKQTLLEIEKGIDFSKPGYAKVADQKYFIYDFFQEFKGEFSYDIHKVTYDFNKTPQEQSIKERNNGLLDLMTGIITNPDTASKIVTPGGFDNLKNTANIVSIISQSSVEKLQELNAAAKEKNISLYAYLKSFGAKPLSDMVKEARANSLDILMPSTQVYFQKQNMTAAEVIGIAAIHAVSHSILQHTQIGFKEKYGFTVNKHKNLSLHDMFTPVKKNGERSFISRTLSEFVAASVDAVKEPVLNFLNINTLTANTAFSMAGLGYTEEEIGLFLSQPIIKDLIKEMENPRNKDNSDISVIKSFMLHYMMIHNIDIKENKIQNIDPIAPELGVLTKNISTSRLLDTLTDEQDGEYRYSQLSIAAAFLKAYTIGEHTSLVIKATRADTSGGSAGPSIADNISKMQDVTELLALVNDPENNPFVGGDIMRNIKMTDKDSLREKIMNSPLPFTQGFYTLGLESTNELMSKYFPHYNKNFQSVINSLRRLTPNKKLNVKTMNSIYDNLFIYLSGNINFFEKGVNKDAREQRLNYIYRFPTYFNKTLNAYPELKELKFINSLTISALKGMDNNALVFKNVGKITDTERKTIQREWASLLQHPNQEVKDFAINLFKYNYYRSGFAFSPNSFIHLAPSEIREAISEYIQHQRDLVENNSIIDDYGSFLMQYLLNHTYNRQLTPEINNKLTSIILVNQDKSPVKEFSVKISKDSEDEDKKIIYREYKGNVGDFKYRPLIVTKIDKKQYFYANTSNGRIGDYVLVNKLGFNNNFFEYEYGVNASLMTSVIKENDYNYVPIANKPARPSAINSRDDIKSEKVTTVYTDAITGEVTYVVDGKEVTEDTFNKYNKNSPLQASPEQVDNFEDAEKKKKC